MKGTVLLSFLLFITIHAIGQQKAEVNFISEKYYHDYVPISPLDFEQNVVIYNNVNDKFDTLSIKKLAKNRSEMLSFLPNETVYSTLEKKNASGEISYGPASVTAEKGSYVITLDYGKFTTLKYTGNNGQCAGYTKVGVGMRITAKITTFESNVNVSSLVGLSLAAKSGKLVGQLSIEIIGMESKQITDLVVLPVDISEASIQAALQSLSAIKSKIYDEKTNLYPQIIAIKKSKGECSVFEALENIEENMVVQQTQGRSNHQQEQIQQQK